MLMIKQFSAKWLYPKNLKRKDNTDMFQTHPPYEYSDSFHTKILKPPLSPR